MTTVTCTNRDVVQICNTKNGKVLKLPAEVILAFYAVFRHAFIQEQDLEVSMVYDDVTREEGWEALLDGRIASRLATTPAIAILDLAQQLEEKNERKRKHH